MEKGDLSNEMPPRILVVANDFLIHIPQRTVFNGGRGFGKWKRIADHIEIDDTVRLYLHDFTWRRTFRVDAVVIGVPEELAERLGERFSRMNLAIANTYSAATEQDVVKRLAYMPDVMYVVHGRDDWTYTFGSRAIKGIQGLRGI